MLLQDSSNSSRETRELSAGYVEYQNSTVCVCIAESVAQAYVIAPSDLRLAAQPQPVVPDRLGNMLLEWFALA